MKEKKILYLSLKKEWYNLIDDGVKTEEYREIKSYWVKRLLCMKNDKIDATNVVYILTEAPYEVLESIIKSDEFIDYIKILKHYKSGGYYTYTSKDLEQFINYKLSLDG